MPRKQKTKKYQIKKLIFLSAWGRENKNDPINSEASSHAASRKGALTLEATLVLPIFVLFLFYFLFYFQVIKMEIQVEQALQYTSRMMAVYAGVGEVPQGSGEEGEQMQELSGGKGLMTEAVAKGMVAAWLKQSGAETDHIKLGVLGLNFSQSDFSGDYIDLIVQYKMQIPFGYFDQIRTVNVSQRACTRKWTGDHGLEEKTDETMVYITPTGSVYHTTKSCNYLDLSIHSVNAQSVEQKRNKSGGKYYACGSCCKGGAKSGTVFLTDYGTNYHKDRNCSGLKRTVIEIPLSKVGGRKACSKCGGK